MKSSWDCLNKFRFDHSVNLGSFAMDFPVIQISGNKLSEYTS